MVRQSICDSRPCECGAIAVGAPGGDWDEVTDEALGFFEMPIRSESRGFDALLREDVRRAGLEIREGISDPDMGHPWSWAYRYTWFRRGSKHIGCRTVAAADGGRDIGPADLIFA